MFLVLIAFCGCSESPAPEADLSSHVSKPSTVQGDDEPELAEEGWPATTKRYPGELVFIAVDGTETVTDLGDATVASVHKTMHPGEPEEFEYHLKFLRHREHADVYEFTYRLPGSEVSRTVSPRLYSGQETLLVEEEIGRFLLRLSPAGLPD